MNTNRLIESRCRLQVAKMGAFWGDLCAAECALIDWWDWSDSMTDLLSS